MRFFVSCARGTEGPLRRELVVLRIRGPRGETGGVSFEGTLEQALAVCLWSRVGVRVLWELGTFEARNAEALYAGTRAIAWQEHLDAQHTLAVSATVRDNPALGHSGFAALKVKDAIVDGLRQRLGARPDVDTTNPDVPVVLHLAGADARIYLDLCGEALHKRGYRKDQGEAPLKESLAAAVLALGRIEADLPFVDPMSGSGTFAIEHALSARHIAPGAARRFAFERWPSQAHDPAWARLKEEARAGVLPRAPCPIVARDISPAATQAARKNAATAGVLADLTFETADIATLGRPEPTGNLCLNLPYGERLGAPDLAPLYEKTARTFSGHRGWRLTVLSGNPLFSRIFLRRPAITHRLWNGPLETRLLVYEPDSARPARHR